MNRNLAFGEYVEGIHELSKMNLRRSTGNRSEYPLVTPLLTGLDCDRLYVDYKNCLPTLSTNYLGDRRNLLGCSFEEAVKELERYGFSQKYYCGYGLMQVGKPRLVGFGTRIYARSSWFAERRRLSRALRGGSAGMGLRFPHRYPSFPNPGFSLETSDQRARLLSISRRRQGTGVSP